MDPVSERIVLVLVKSISFKNRKFQKDVFKKDVLQKPCGVGSMHSKCMLIINGWKVQGKLSSVGSA